MGTRCVFNKRVEMTVMMWSGFKDWLISVLRFLFAFFFLFSSCFSFVEGRVPALVLSGLALHIFLCFCCRAAG
jgi:hypothetical protein